MPVLANLGLYFLQFITQNNSLLLKPWQLIFVIISVSIYFEIVLPLCKPSRYTADIYDVLCYVLGGIFFLAIGKIKKQLN